MPLREPSFSIGIEEEYLLVDRQSRDLVSEPPPALIDAYEIRLSGHFSREFLRTQIEVGTSVCGSIAEARADLMHLRRTVAEIAREHGLAPIAASTHPFAQWRKQKPTDKLRYRILQEDMQVVAHRLLICGMHVHVGIEEDNLRIDLFNQVPYFLPHLLALSTSSPFWEGTETGLRSYRLCVFDELPRTGLPENFASYGEYRRAVELMIAAGLVEDATKIWWDVRPSARFPTLEMRITDVCTRIDDAICCAALFRCVCRMLYRLRRDNQRWRVYARMLVEENRWRAQRYGLDQGMVDFGRGEIVPFPDLMEELLGILREDAEFFDCVNEIEHARNIISRGTSSHMQVEAYRAALQSGATPEEALRRVVDALIEATEAGL
ncbi:MAG: carboxylate-amine ligase [Bryobacterales bacterium]|nr:carboxylate-amine ligase [Bryobacterales bacterium]MDE0293682.1 carboxylate-amine ligase [Bryobacterales bacterium]